MKPAWVSGHHMFRVISRLAAQRRAMFYGEP
jgi:hypothetical protein